MRQTLSFILIMCLLSIFGFGCKTYHLKEGNYVSNEFIFGGKNPTKIVTPYLGYAAISPTGNSKPLEPFNQVNVKYQPGYYMLNPNPGLRNNGKPIILSKDESAKLLVALSKSYTFDLGLTLNNVENNKSILDQQIAALQSNGTSTKELESASKSLKFEIELFRFLLSKSNSLSFKITDLHSYIQLDPSKYSYNPVSIKKVCSKGKINKEEPNAYVSTVYEISGDLELKTDSQFDTGLKASFDNKLVELKKMTGIDGSINLKYNSSDGNYHKLTITNAWMLFYTRTLSDSDCPKE